MCPLSSLSSPEVFNVTLTTTGIEYSQVVQDISINIAYLKSIQIRSKEAQDLRCAFITSGPYFTIPSGNTYWQDNMDMPNLTVYLVGAIDGQIAEILVWR